MKKKQSLKKRSLELTCKDCQRTYRAGAPHSMFCPAHTCRNCGSTFSYVLPIYDSRPEALDEESLPERRCDRCLEDETHDPAGDTKNLNEV